MSTWVIVSWVFVALLTGINIFVFLKLKGASEQMMKMAFPNAKNMNEALSQMQGMMSGMGGGGFGGAPMGAAGSNRGAAKAFGGGSQMDAQLKAAMDVLAKSKKK